MKLAKGMRDFLPQQMMQRERIFSTVAEVYREFGFQPLETPALEYLTTLRAKSGEEIAGQLFEIKDSELALRFDLTVPLSRVAANSQFPQPFKRYQIGPVWRREEPQKGRFREFWQADADIIGSSSMRTEAELLDVASTALSRIGFGKFQIALSNRKILNSIVEKFKLEEKANGILRIIDKADKIGREEVERQLAPFFGSASKEILPLLFTKGSNDKKLDAFEKYAPEGVKEVREIQDLYPHFTFDPLVIRGLGYYSGPVYEFRAEGFSGSFAGGGRYDGLLGIYGRGAPAAGVSLGVERILMLMGEEGEKKTYSEVFVVTFPETYPEGMKVADKLRKAGICTETDLMGRNIRKQMDYAGSLLIPWVIVLGKKEIEEKKVNLRNMKTGDEKLLTLEQAIKAIRGNP